MKQPVTIRLGHDTVEYSKTLTAKTGFPHKSPINLDFRDCAAKQRELSWLS